MGLSRLDNFLKSVRGTIIYVDPNSLDATDSIENQGNSLTRPFKTIQRALVEASRFSYQRGLDNDRFNKTTIVLYPGDHVVDNRPGWIPDGSNNYRLRSGATSNDFGAWDLTTNFDLTTDNNALYKLNSIYGGVIIPRGTSIVGMDLRKTKIRPKYVPNPAIDDIERSAVFRVTGGCYFWQFSVLDADPNDVCYKDYTTNTFVPNFSHHKLTAFEYADGVNDVSIADDFQTYSTDRTDLDMYYEKVGLAYGPASGREIQPDYPSSSLDIQTKIDEYRIVGSRGTEVGITSIRAGDGVTSSTTITVTLSTAATEFDVDTPIQIQGVGSSGYDGQYVVFNKVDSTNIQYKVQNTPANPLPTVTSATINVAVDTVTSASPYIFNISMRSVYGMCGLHADGAKAAGFKSMVVAQFTGIGLQKDDNAFVKYNSTSGTYEDSTAAGNSNIHSDSRARFKPSYENYHIKCSNEGYLQLVSVFAIGYANHFLAESGGDQSINNSNSNFGAKSLVASGFRKNAFTRDDVGYVTHVIPPKENENTETSIEFTAIDVNKTVGIASTNRLYLYNETNSALAPETVIDGYRIGARVNEQLNVLISQSGGSATYSARIIMPNTQFTANETSSEKKFIVGRSVAGINSITSNVFTLTTNHAFINGETIRIISETGQLPNGLTNNQVYFAITSGTGIVSSNQLKIAQTLNDALGDNPIIVNSNGGILNVVSRVSDKKAGDIGHPVQFDSTGGQWYVNVATAATERSLYNVVVGLGSTGLGAATPRSYVNRKSDTRNLTDTIYRLRYVIPADSPITARPPIDGYVIQESNTSIGSTNTEVGFLYNPTPVTLSNSTQLRNPRYIAGANWTGGTANIITEIPHDLNVGSEVEILNITSTNNVTGVANSAYNGTFSVAGISSAKQFSVAIANNPGTFTNNTSSRTTSLPYFKRKKTPGTYYVYRSQEIQEYVPGQQDGVYHLLVVNASNSPSVAPFTSLRFSQPIQSLYPQTNRDNPNSDPQAAVSFALPDTVGQVVINEPQYSVTKETLNKQLVDGSVGVGLTQIVSGVAGTTHTLYTNIDHGLNRATGLTITNAGTNYVNGNYYNVSLVGFAGSTTGSHATARVTVSGGSITSVKIIDGGSAYGVGNTLAVVGVATTTGNTAAYLTVSNIYSNVNDTLSIDGITPSSYSGYNNLYRITAINGTKEIAVASASTISPAYTAGIGVTVAATGNVILTGRTLNVSSIAYNGTVGLATITTVQTHGLQVDNKVRIGGADANLLNGDFVIKQVVSTNTFVANVGISTLTPVTTGNIFVYQPAYSSNGGNLVRATENSSGRLIAEYAGITTTISSAVTATDATIAIANVTNFDFNVGDYLLIDSEIVRIKSAVTGNPVSVFRGLLGTLNSSHSSGSVVKRIKPRPIELRRNSLIRASAHTFEYLGFGPGNYSTAFPERQDRNISPQEELLAQSTKTDGGIAIFTAMNADGDFYTGNKKVNSATGQEEVFDAPIPTVTGEDLGVGGVNVGFDVLSPLEASISRSLRVEGGPDANLISEFDGPVVFNNKITSTSSKGIEAASLYLQGDQTVSRKYTVGIATPALAGNAGDVQYDAVPASGGLLGWVYTSNNRWERFGRIGLNGAEPSAAVGVASGGNYVGLSTLINFVGSGITITSVYNSTVGVATFTFDANPRVAISTGSANNYIGLATQINFVGYGITISSEYNAVSGIATVLFTGGVGLGGTGSPGGGSGSVQFNNSGYFGGNSVFSFDGNSVKINNSHTGPLLRVIQTGSGNAFQVEDAAGDTTPFVISNDGSVGVGSGVPTAKVEIVASSQEALRIKSTSGSGNIVRVDSSATDTTPVIIDTTGNVGINTVAAIASLDVVGNAAITGVVRVYNSNRSFYVGLQPPTLTSNVILTLPQVVGAASSVLYTTGSGILDWVSPQALVALGLTNTDGLAEGSSNLYFTEERAQDAIGAAINAGIQTGITVTYDDANNRINFNNAAATPYPFTTKGFSIPI
jgi:hypothetical protein